MDGCYLQLLLQMDVICNDCYRWMLFAMTVTDGCYLQLLLQSTLAATRYLASILEASWKEACIWTEGSLFVLNMEGRSVQPSPWSDFSKPIGAP
jgi:hypothetical protein